MGDALPALSPQPEKFARQCHPRACPEDPSRRILPAFNRCGAMRSYWTLHVCASTLPGVAPVPRLDLRRALDPRTKSEDDS